MDVQKVQKGLTKEKWKSIISDKKNFDMTNKEYCKYIGVSEATFYHWQQYFRQEECDHALEAGLITADANFVPLTIQEPIATCTEISNSTVKIHVGDTVLDIPNDISDDLLQKIWRLIKC